MFEIDKEFKLVNDELKSLDLRAELMIVGGMALIMQNINFRYTFDIDCYLLSKSSTDVIKSVLSVHFINNNCQSICMLPDLDDFTIVDVIKFSHLTIYVASVDDIVLMKAFSTRQKDYDDLTHYILKQIDVKTFFDRCKNHESFYIGNLELTNYKMLKQKLESEKLRN